MSLRSWKDKKVPEESHAGEYKLQQTEMQWNTVIMTEFVLSLLVCFWDSLA